MKKDKNMAAIKGLDTKKYEGKCIGLADGKVVVQGTNPIMVMDKLMKGYAGRHIMVTSVPKKNVNFVL